MGRRPNTTTRRKEIVDALKAEISTTGYERATIKTIAAQAGLAPGLVHYHFRNKEEILLELVDELIADAEQRSADALAIDADPVAQLNAYTGARVGLGEPSDPQQVRVWVNLIAEAMSVPAVKTRISEWLAGDYTTLRRIFTDAGDENAAQNASLLLAMILGAFSLHSLELDGIPHGYAAPSIKRWLDTITSKPS